MDMPSVRKFRNVTQGFVIEAYVIGEKDVRNGKLPHLKERLGVVLDQSFPNELYASALAKYMRQPFIAVIRSDGKAVVTYSGCPAAGMGDEFVMLRTPSKTKDWDEESWRRMRKLRREAYEGVYGCPGDPFSR